MAVRNILAQAVGLGGVYMLFSLYQQKDRPALLDRNGFGIVRVNPNDLARSVPVLVADMQDSLFYPYAEVHGGEMYLSYTVDRKHIRSARVDARKYLKG